MPELRPDDDQNDMTGLEAAAHPPDDTVPCSMREFVGYFLRLGALGFGGPIALAGHMERDLVERRRWLTKQDFTEGMALAQLAPGPLAAQLAIYLGWVRGGALGATLTGFAFVLPAFLMVLPLAYVYLHFGGLPWITGAFYGVGAAVIAIISLSAYKLLRRMVGHDWLLWGLWGVNAAVTVATRSEIVWLFILSGVIALLVKAPPQRHPRSQALGWLPFGELLATGMMGVATPETIGQLAWYFTKAGAVVFGSGLAIVPFLYSGVVTQFHWLNERQFLDAVAVAMITPGPVVITSAFIGYLVAGPLGATVAALGVFLPCYLIVVIAAPYYRRFAKNAQIKAFVSGVTAAAIGAITGSVVILAKGSIVDLPTAFIALAALLALITAKKAPEPIIILAAAVIGLVVKGAVG